MSRLENTILYLLSRAQKRGRENLSKFELFKFLYLLEVESFQFTGNSFINSITFVRDKNGPISLDIYKALSHLLAFNYVKMREIKKTDYPYPRHCLTVSKPVKKSGFTHSEKLFMNSVFESYFPLSIKQLKSKVYNTEPMRKILKEEKQKKAIMKGSQMDFTTIPLDQDMIDLVAAKI